MFNKQKTIYKSNLNTVDKKPLSIHLKNNNFEYFNNSNNNNKAPLTTRNEKEKISIKIFNM
jgi:protease II